MTAATTEAYVARNLGGHSADVDHSDCTGYRALALAVIERALADLHCDHWVDGNTRGGVRAQAMRFLTARGGPDRADRIMWCELAGIEPEYLDRAVNRRLRLPYS